MNIESIIFIQILDEGTVCYRAVPATKLSENRYLVHGQELHDPEDEEWQFLPGTIVRTEEKELTGFGRIRNKRLVAVEEHSEK